MNTTTITAIREGQPVRFNITSENSADQVLREWQASPMAKGCTRAAISSSGTADVRAHMRSHDAAKFDIDALALNSFRCETCGVKTLQNSSDQSSSRYHAVGCRAAQKGDLVTTIHFSYTIHFS